VQVLLNTKENNTGQVGQRAGKHVIWNCWKCTVQ